MPTEWHNKPHPSPQHSFGETYLEHREFLEFPINLHKELKAYCDKIDIKYSSSVWDITSAKEIMELNPSYIKIPSACNNNFALLETLFKYYDKDVHISLGMSTHPEIKRLIDYLRPYRDRTVIYWTTSGYPVQFEELFLLEIENIPDEFRKGYSGHNLGIAADIAAFTLGANYIERHFTLDRTFKGNDQAASLEPQGLMKLCRDLKAVQKALKYKTIDLTETEKLNREKLRGY